VHAVADLERAPLLTLLEKVSLLSSETQRRQITICVVGRFQVSLTMETKAKLIMNAIKLDRSEIRLTRERIYTTVSYIAAASFAITAFLVGPQLTERDH
jgi:hypothetical protein